jgi:hypothetical protein
MSAKSTILAGIAALTVACAIGMLAGCGSSSARSASAAPAASATEPNPALAASATATAASVGNFNSCSVVTQAEAASAIGQAVTPGVLGHATVEGGLACVFYGPSAPTPANPDVAQPDSVRVVVVVGSDALTWYNDYKSKVSARPVTGYGDKAYYDGYASLSVLDGDCYLRVAVSPADAPPSLSAEEKLAAAIVPKLQPRP